MVTQLQNCKNNPKEWGNEIIWAEGKNYLGKYFMIAPGKRIDSSSTNKKEKTIFVMLGELVVWKSEDQNDFIVLKQNDVCHLNSNQFYGLGCTSESQYPAILMEISDQKED